MTDFADFMESSDSGDAPRLGEIRLGGEPATVVLFTSTVEGVVLHYEPSEDYHCYVVCPGGRCPLCFIGAAPQRAVLLPVVNLESNQVQVLRVPISKGTGSLAAALGPLLKRADIAMSVVIVSRTDNVFSAVTRPLAPGIDSGFRAIEQFITAHEAGLKLASVFPQPTAEELASVERIRRKLDAFGGYPPPDPKPKPPPDPEPQPPPNPEPK